MSYEQSIDQRGTAHATLREKLEYIWETQPIKHPGHITQWHLEGGALELPVCKPGRKVVPKYVRADGKKISPNHARIRREFKGV